MTKEIIPIRPTIFITEQLNKYFFNALFKRSIFSLGSCTQSGKSYFAQNYLPPKNATAIYLKVDDTMTKKSFEISLNNRLNNIDEDFTFNHRSIRTIRKENIKLLLANPKRTLLIIDEYGLFKLEILISLRNIWMETNDKIGIVLLGPPEFEEHLDKMVEKKILGAPEFESRIRFKEIIYENCFL